MRNVTAVFVQHVQSAFLIRPVACVDVCVADVCVCVPPVRVSSLLYRAAPFPYFLSASQTAVWRLRTPSPWRRGC